MANNKDDEQPSYSPDGKKIAYTVYNDSQDDIYTINAFGGGKTQVTNTDNADENVPSWEAVRSGFCCGRSHRPRRSRRGSGSLAASALSLALIHRSAWKGNSANFAKTEFLEVRSMGRSTPGSPTLLAEG